MGKDAPAPEEGRRAVLGPLSRAAADGARAAADVARSGDVEVEAAFSDEATAQEAKALQEALALQEGRALQQVEVATTCVEEANDALDLAQQAVDATSGAIGAAQADRAKHEGRVAEAEEVADQLRKALQVRLQP